MAARDRIKGITIEIDGNTTKLQDALKKVNSDLKQTGTALGDVNRLLKDPGSTGNAELLAQKQKLLTQAVEDTKKKLEQERDALRQVSDAAPNFDAWKAANEPIQKSIDDTNKKLRDLKEQAKNTQAALADGTASTEQYDRLQAEIQDTENTLKELRAERKRVGDEFGDPISPEQFDALQREIVETEDGLKRLEKQVEDFGSVSAQQLAAAGGKMQEVGGKITDAGKALAPVSGAAAGALAASAKAAIDWESAFTGVKKTNEELVDENGKVIISYDDLAESIKKMATETASSKAEIAAVMEAAGQLGVGTQYLEEFTRTMIMLGDSTNLSADEAATALAKFANVTGMSLDDVDKLGAALVELGNNFATDEQSIVEMATRLAGAGAQIGLTEGEILGFATALSSVGIEAEMGGSAFSKAMIKMQVAAETGFSDVNALMGQFGDILGEDFDSFREFELFWKNLSGKDQKEFASSLQMTTAEITKLVNSRAELEGFADVAGMTAEQFVELYGKSAPDALSAFIQGLADTEGRGESTIQMLQDMGLTEVRLRDTLTRAANASELFSDALATGNRAFEENTALTEEAQKRYETYEALISQTRETISNLAIDIGNELLPIIKEMLESVQGAVKWFSGLDDGAKKNIVRIGLLVAAISPLLIAIGSITSGVGTLLTLAPQISTAITAVKGGAAALWAVLSANPVGLIIAGITGLITVIVLLYNKCEWFRNKVKPIVDWFANAWETVKKAASFIFGANEDSGGSKSQSGVRVQSYASGYQNAMILQSPTIFGRGRSGSYLMGGDGAGAEAVVGTDLLGRIVRENSGFGGDIVIPVSIGGTQLERVVVRANQINTFRRG